MTKPNKQEPKPATVEEALARLQLAVDKRLEEFHAEVRQELANMKTKLGGLDDFRQGVNEQLSKLDATVKQNSHDTTLALREANVLLRQAVEQTSQAQQSVAVYERMRESTPDQSEAVGNLARKVGEAQDHLRELQADVQGLRVQLEEAVSGDYAHEEEETAETSEATALAQTILKRDAESKAQAASR